MIFLELAMLAIGIAAVVYSYRKVKEEAAATPPLDEESQALLKKLEDTLQELQERYGKSLQKWAIT